MDTKRIERIIGSSKVCEKTFCEECMYEGVECIDTINNKEIGEIVEELYNKIKHLEG